MEPSQENGARVENGDDVFPSKSKAPGSPPPNQEALGDGVEGTLGSAEKPSRRSLCNNTEKSEEGMGTPEEASAGEKAGQNPDTASQAGLEVPEPPETCLTEAEKGCESQLDGTEAGERTDAGTATEGTASEESLADEEEGFGQKNPSSKTPEEGAVREKAPQSPELKEGPPLEPGCSPGVDNAPAETSNEIQNTQEASTVGNSDGSYHGIMVSWYHGWRCPRCHMSCSSLSGVKSAQYAETITSPSPCADPIETDCGARREGASHVLACFRLTGPASGCAWSEQGVMTTR